MRLLSQRLRGIGRFDGDVEIPISKLEPDDRLVAVVGGNGTGKSTGLGSIPGTLYREIPGYGSVARMATGRDSLLEQCMEVGGQTLVAKLLINGAANPPKQQAYLSVDGVHSVKIDAKITVTDRVRCATITTAPTLAEQIEAEWEARDQRPERAEPILGKLGEIMEEIV